MNAKRIVITGIRQVELQDFEIPDAPGPGEVLVETECTFISTGTELSIYTALEPMALEPGSWCAHPWPAGYANVGVVRAVGEGVEDFSPGQRVFSTAGHGSHAMLSAGAMAVPVPEGLDPVDAVASRMAGVATAALTVTEFSFNPWVVVYGLGMVGNLAAQSYRIMGGRVIGVDPVESRRNLARKCGIPHTVGGTREEVPEAIREITGGAMATISVDAVGHSAVIEQALGATADYGQIILLGTPRAPVETNVTELWKDIHLRWITVRGALEWNLPIRGGKGNDGGPIGFSLVDKQKAIFDWIARGEMDVRSLVSHVLPPERVSDAYEGLRTDPETFTGVAFDWRAK